MSVEFSRPRKAEPSLNLTPLIDVIFQLLVFFMLASTFSYPALQLSLPKAEAEAETQKPQVFVLSLDAEGQLYLNRDPISEQSLEAALRSAFADVSQPIVHFRGDRDLPYARFVELMQATGRAGAAGFYLIHEDSAQ
jgi:biopolymer transport protein ExbD